jgi:hypothetical protein
MSQGLILERVAMAALTLVRPRRWQRLLLRLPQAALTLQHPHQHPRPHQRLWRTISTSWVVVVRLCLLQCRHRRQPRRLMTSMTCSEAQPCRHQPPRLLPWLLDPQPTISTCLENRQQRPHLQPR